MTPYSYHQSILHCLFASFQMLFGRARANAVFEYSAHAFWQVVITYWLLGMMISAPLLSIVGLWIGEPFSLSLFGRTSLASLLSILVFAFMMWRILYKSDLAWMFLPLVIPLFWLSVMQNLFVGAVILLVFMVGQITLLSLVLPILIWFVIRQFYLIKEQLPMRAFTILVVMFMRFILDVTVNQVVHSLPIILARLAGT